MATNPDIPRSSRYNPAVVRCAKAYSRTYKLVSRSLLAADKPLDRHFVKQHAAYAFRNALPPLCGPENIRDFIACVGYALVKEFLDPVDCAEYFAAAKVALAAIRAERHPAKPRAA